MSPRAYDATMAEAAGSDDARRLTVFVRGRVQGVGFRWLTARGPWSWAWPGTRATPLTGGWRSWPKVQRECWASSLTSSVSSRRRLDGPGTWRRCRPRCGPAERGDRVPGGMNPRRPVGRGREDAAYRGVDGTFAGAPGLPTMAG